LIVVDGDEKRRDAKRRNDSFHLRMTRNKKTLAAFDKLLSFWNSQRNAAGK
jgi:hypothetical protein